MAQQLADRYAELGFAAFKGGISDEPLLSIALAVHGISADPRDADASMTQLGLQGSPRIDVIGGHAELTKNGRRVTPAVVHFAAEHSEDNSPEGAYYRRER